MQTPKIGSIKLLLVFVCLNSCSKSDSSSKEEEKPMEKEMAENRPPKDFSLKSVENGAENTDITPVLVWDAAIDPDGDTVTYDVYLDEQETPTKLFAENISETTIIIGEPLSLSSQYYWRIVAKDGVDGVTESDVFAFTTKEVDLNFKTVTASAAFSRRSGHTTVAFDNKLWVIGGRSFSGGKYSNTNDVWFSEDGENWQEATENASFSPRFSHASVVFDDKIWVIGGRSDSEDFKNDVWYSSDGISWVEATSNSTFPVREDHSVAVFDDKLWVIGGWDLDYGLKNDVWYSSDGIIWDQATASTPFTKRAAHGMVVFDDKLWVIAGNSYPSNKNDVWYSDDGIIWNQVTNVAPFSKRNALATAVYDDKLWVIGGYDNPDLKSDIWYSSDGIDWAQATANAPFGGRAGHTTAVLDNKIWIIGGVFESNDVWAFD